MRHVLPLAVLAVAAVGCAKNIPVAEGEASELLRQTYAATSFENEEEEEQLQSLLLAMHDNYMGNLDLEYDERAINPGVLTEIDGLPQPPDTNLEDQTPIGLAGRSSHPLSKHLEGMQDTNQNCMGSDSTYYSQKTWTEGEDCFFDGSCDYSTSESRSFTKNPLAKVWIDSFADYYRTTIPFEDIEVDAIVSRGWIADIFKSGHDGDGGAEWRQRYTLDVYYEDPADTSKTLRMHMYWSEAKLIVGDDVYVKAVLDGLHENYVNVDAFYDGEVCERRDATEEEMRENE